MTHLPVEIPKKAGIYKLTNKINGRVYIGKTINNLRGRIGQHRTMTTKYPIDSAIRKYGFDNFEIEIINWYDDNEISDIELIALEVACIDAYDSLTSKNGYNVLLFSFNRMGIPHSEETKEKLRNKKRTPEQNKRNSDAQKKKYADGFVSPWLGKPKSEESKRKLSLAKLGKPGACYDKTIYTFKNLESGEIFTGFKRDFYKKFDLHIGGICELARKKVKHYDGWILID